MYKKRLVDFAFVCFTFAGSYKIDCKLGKMAEARPKLTGNEDELLKMQQDFLAGRIAKSSVEIVEAPGRKKPQEECKRKSIFAERRARVNDEKRRPLAYEFPKVQVLRDVVERTFPSDLEERTFPSDLEHCFTKNPQQPFTQERCTSYILMVRDTFA